MVRITVALLLLALLPAAGGGQPRTASPANTPPLRLLVLDLGDPLRPGFTGLMPAIREGITSRLDRPVEFLLEHAEPRLGADSAFVVSMVRWWTQRYDLPSLDAVLVIGVTEPRMLGWIRPTIPTSVPLTYFARGVLASSIAAVADSLPNVFGVSNGDIIAEGIPLIWRLLPATRHVVAITEGEAEGARIASLLRSLAPTGTEVAVRLRPTVEDLIALSDSLPPTAVFLYAGVNRDRLERSWVPAEFVEAFAPEVPQPVFVTARDHVTTGVLGGLVSDVKTNGQFLANRIADAVTGIVTDTVGVAVITQRAAVWRDWSMMDFDIDRGALPDGSIVLEMNPTVWTLYPRGSILVSALAVGLVLLAILLARRNRKIRRANAELRTSKLLVVRSLASVAETRDNDTGLHIRRTQEYMRVICTALRADGRFTAVLSREMIEQLYLAAPLHDIGKVGIPDTILRKPGVLGSEERAVMQQHTTMGRDLLARAQRDAGAETSFFTIAMEIAQSHHERWDGTGYPHGLAGDAIPLSARLMALADVYDALRSERPYKIKQTHDDVERFILSERGRHFDPAIVDAFARSKERFVEIATSFGDTGA